MRQNYNHSIMGTSRPAIAQHFVNFKKGWFSGKNKVALLYVRNYVQGLGDTWEKATLKSKKWIMEKVIVGQLKLGDEILKGNTK